jgi:hypothetical protein
MSSEDGTVAQVVDNLRTDSQSLGRIFQAYQPTVNDAGGRSQFLAAHTGTGPRDYTRYVGGWRLPSSCADWLVPLSRAHGLPGAPVRE